MDVNPWDLIRRGLDQQRELERAIDGNSNVIARALLRCLRSVSTGLLCELKRQLRNFDMAKREWRP